MKRFLPFLLIPILSGCFKDEPKLPQYYAKQEIDMAVDSVICYSLWEEFDDYVIFNSQSYDSLQWFRGNSFVSNEDSILIPVGANGWSQISCLAFNGMDTVEYLLQLNYCGRFIYIPLAFTTTGDGINDFWQPVVNFENAPNSYSIYWEIRTLDGIQVFSTSEMNGRWDGSYNGSRLPHGAYLYYIELTISGEDPLIYTGWLEMLG